MSKIQTVKSVLSIGLASLCYVLSSGHLPEPVSRILFIFVIAALFWAFEIIPLYATSILVVLLEIFLLCLPGKLEGMEQIGYDVFLSQFGNPILILFFGGFILAHALNKYNIDRLVASKLLKVFGRKPYFIMLGFMITTASLSMWMSDTATTAMMIAMVMPFLKQMDKEDPFRTGLILAIPFSALIGGMATPVGTPPNAIAIGILAERNIHINFFSWMKMALPLAGILLFTASAILYGFYPSSSKELHLNITYKEKINSKVIQVMAIALLTILLWLTSSFHKIPSAVVALLAAGLFSFTGLLKKDDFKQINWDVLILMWGGLALGKGMELSGFADLVVSLPLFEQKGMILVIIFCVLAVVLSTFMSNTAAATLLIPVAVAVPGESSVILAVTIAMSCSLAMVLPVSTPPNAIAFSTDMLRSRDMIKAGAVISLISVILIICGYKFMITQILGLE